MWQKQNLVNDLIPPPTSVTPLVKYISVVPKFDFRYFGLQFARIFNIVDFPLPVRPSKQTIGKPRHLSQSAVNLESISWNAWIGSNAVSKLVSKDNLSHLKFSAPRYEIHLFWSQIRQFAFMPKRILFDAPKPHNVWTDLSENSRQTQRFGRRNPSQCISISNGIWLSQNREISA